MYAIALMMKYPEIQDKVQEEIRKATGDNELVTLADKDNLPYTEATLNEVWRFCNIVPFTGPRKVAGQLKVGNFEIPSGVYCQAPVADLRRRPEGAMPPLVRKQLLRRRTNCF